MAATNPPARLNRGLLAVLGIVLVVVGLGALAVSLGRLPLLDPTAPLVTPPSPAPGWLPWAGTAAGVVVGLLALRWLVAQARRRPRAATWELPRDRSGPEGPTAAGRTRIGSSAALEPLLDELESLATINRARGRLLGDAARPDLLLEVTLTDDADPAAVRAHVDEQALPRLRTALDLGALPTRLLLRVGGGSSDDRRVR